MPRTSIYQKNSANYKQKSKEYYYKKLFQKNSFLVPIGNNILDYVNELKEFYDCKSVSKVFKIISKAIAGGQLYSCGGYFFTPLSQFQPTAYLASSYVTGSERLKAWIPYLDQIYASNNGFSVYVNPIEKHGVDILVNKNGNPYTVIELTNYRQDTYLSYNDVQRYINSLNVWDKHDCFKIIVVSFPENLKHRKQPDLWEGFSKNKIGIKVLGYQD